MHTIDIVDGWMVVLDPDGNGCEAHELTGYRLAKQEVQCWTWRYAINVAEAYGKLSAFFSR